MITWAESLKVREKIDSRFLHNKNSSMIADEMRSTFYHVPKSKTFKVTYEDYEIYDESRVKEEIFCLKSKS